MKSRAWLLAAALWSACGPRPDPDVDPPPPASLRLAPELSPDAARWLQDLGFAAEAVHVHVADARMIGLDPQDPTELGPPLWPEARLLRAGRRIRLPAASDRRDGTDAALGVYLRIAPSAALGQASVRILGRWTDSASVSVQRADAPGEPNEQAAGAPDDASTDDASGTTDSRWIGWQAFAGGDSEGLGPDVDPALSARPAEKDSEGLGPDVDPADERTASPRQPRGGHGQRTNDGDDGAGSGDRATPPSWSDSVVVRRVHAEADVNGRASDDPTQPVESARQALRRPGRDDRFELLIPMEADLVLTWFSGGDGTIELPILSPEWKPVPPAPEE